MPGRSSNTRTGQLLGVLVAALAVGLFVIDGATDLSVPYGYGGDAFLVGAAVAIVAVAIVGWRYRERVLG